MKKIFIFLLISSFFKLSILFSQTTFWKQYYPSTGFSDCIYQIPDGRILIGTNAPIVYDSLTGIYAPTIQLFQLDSYGNTLLNKLFLIPDSGVSTTTGIDLTKDSCYIIVGRAGNFSSSYNGIGMLKMDFNGNIKWIKNLTPYCHPLFIKFSTVVSTNDGGFALLAETANYELVFVKTDSIGNEEWTKVYKNHDRLTPVKIGQLNDSSFLILSSTYNNLLLIKTNSHGDVLWSKSSTDSTLGIPTKMMIENDSMVSIIYSTGMMHLNLNSNNSLLKTYSTNIYSFSKCSNSDYVFISIDSNTNNNIMSF
jgi:hypothetical protein